MDDVVNRAARVIVTPVSWDSPEAERLMQECIADGEACAVEHGGCDACPLLQFCNGIWDKNVWRPEQLKEAMRVVYMIRRKA